MDDGPHRIAAQWSVPRETMPHFGGIRMRGVASRPGRLAVGLILLTLLWAPSATAAETGESAPEIGRGAWVNAPDGTRLSDFAGEVVLIDLWGIQCPPCIASLDRLDRLYREKRAEGLQVLALHVQERGNLARQFFESRGYAMPATFDPAVYDRLPRPGTIPHSIVVNAEGEVAFRGDPEEAVRVALAELERLHEPAPAPATTQAPAVTCPEGMAPAVDAETGVLSCRPVPEPIILAE
jgi:thiol-disulfide isomerase/thioredoxin